MCGVFVVIKLLLLKMLLMALTSLTMAFHYDYGYHPSAEEFDNLLRETQRTWTQSVLKNERDNFFIKSINRHQDSEENRARHFVPKFHYKNNESKKFQQLKKSPLLNQDLGKYSKPLTNIGSSLDFHHFNDELPKPLIQQTFRRKPTVVTLDVKPQINLKPVGEPTILKYDKYSLENSYKNKTQTSFPIYFTNPATSIIYAITEIGKSTENVTTSNGTVPIFITKEQYERDILQLENEYKQKCQNSPARTTTFRPEIITLIKKPAAVNFTVIKQPSPVVIKTELMVQDKRPLRKRKKKTNQKHKVQKQNPGTFKLLNTTVKPGLISQLEGPVIVLGSRIYKSKEKLSTQLEKPDIDNIFSSSVMPNISTKNHKVEKRSVEKKVSEMQKRSKAEIFSNLGNSFTTFSRPQKSFLKNLKNFLQNFSKAKIQPDLYEAGITFRKIGKISPEKSTRKTEKNLFSQKLFSNPEKRTPGHLKYLKNSKNIKLTKSKEQLFKIPKFSVILNELINEIKTNRTKHKSDLKNLHKNKFKFLNFKIIKKNLKQQSKYANSKLSKTTNHFKDDFKHHINKRSIVGWVKNMSTLAPFVKSSDKFQNTTLNQREHENTAANEFKIKENQSFQHKNNTRINSTQTTRNRGRPFNLTIQADKKTNLSHFKMPKMLSEVNLNNKLKINFNSTFNKRNNTQRLIATPRTIKRSKKSHKSQAPIYKELRQKSKRKQQDTEYNFFDMEENYDDDDEEEYEDDDNNDEEEEEYNDQDNYKYRHKIFAYDDESYQTPSANRTLEIKQEHLKNPANDKATYFKKRTRRRPPHLKINDDYEDDDEDDNSLSSNLSGFFRMIFYPVQMVMSSVVDSFSIKDADEDDAEQNINPYTKYTSYHSMLKQHSSDDYDDEDYDTNESSDYSFSNWFKSWFAFNRRNKKIGSTTAAPIGTKPTKSSSWFSSWLGFGANDRISTEAASNEDYNEYDKWFASWFGETRPKARKRTTTTTSTTTQIPHVPILTIVDPMKNPQNWIGILAHHIINHTSTANPLKNIWNTVTTTTTENPELPRKVSYDKYQIWRLKPQDVSQVKALEEYKKSEDGIKLQWLKGPSLRGLTDVLVPPKMLVDFQASLTFELIDHEVLIFDVGKAIAYEKTKEDYFFTTTQKPKNRVSKIPTQLKGMTWHKYYEYDDIVNYLETMRMRFPYLVELIHIGRSYEGRPLIVVKIESKEAAAVNSGNYPAHQRTKLQHRKHIGLASAVFIEAGIHGMEWIAPATATWIINELLRIMKKNTTDDHSFIRNTTWYIMPVLNPDGYVYSHEFDRFWKKSRSRHISRPSGIFNSAMTWLQKKRVKEKICFGVDLDRNWHYQWGRRGSSKSACNDFYAGPTSFSEPETKALSDFLMDYRTQIKLFVSMQAYGQIISYPNKANKTYDYERLEDLLDVAMVGIDGLRKKGSKSRYKIDSSNDLIENRSGSSDAFAAYEAGIPFSYTLQLADNGVHGYLLPSASIESTARDSFEIIKGMLDYI